MDTAPDRVEAAFDAVAREDFLPPGARWRAAYDGPLSIGAGQTNSQPRTVAAMLRLLEVAPGQRILDVGAGSGWATALLAHLTGEDGLVIGVELEPSLVEFGAGNLARTPYRNASIHQAISEVLGMPADGPYDRILVSAEATTLPGELVEQLVDGGRMVVPVRGRMLLVVRNGEDILTSEHGSYRFVPLR